MKARIYKPAKTAMQSGRGNTKRWVLEYIAESGKTIDPLMGWVGCHGTSGQVRLYFDSLDEAKAYAERENIPFEVKMPHTRRKHIQAYSDNFK